MTTPRKANKFTRRDAGHARSSDLAMRLLLRFWAGDVLHADDETGTLYLVRSQPPLDAFTLRVELLDELEHTLGFVKTPEPGNTVALTYKGKAALAEFLRRANSSVRALTNRAGQRLVLRADP